MKLYLRERDREKKATNQRLQSFKENRLGKRSTTKTQTLRICKSNFFGSTVYKIHNVGFEWKKEAKIEDRYIGVLQLARGKKCVKWFKQLI